MTFPHVLFVYIIHHSLMDLYQVIKNIVIKKEPTFQSFLWRETKKIYK